MGKRFIFLTIFFIAYKLISNAESIGVDYVHSFTDSAEKVINKHATILESGASNLSYFMKILIKIFKNG